ncbi:putative synaptogyrin-3 [Apostichopus japonicus]|uniref:Putative synaptogyrin-3 n=1 Tax=Stichopus japonicus TaxID=307972 RepID=A0A2G8L643_STIJA|nr:putative synaptogyrin-3 [Apostichopus japonicus]
MTVLISHCNIKYCRSLHIFLLFALIQFSCLAAGAHYKLNGKTQCVLKDGTGPCGFLVFIGVMAFLETMVFLAVDAVFDNWSNINHRKYAVMADMGFSAAWVFFWFLAFCINVASWKKTTIEIPHGGGKIGTAIAFSFFSIFTWGGLAVMAFFRYRQGSETAFAPSFESSVPNIPPANPYPSDVAQPPRDNYQQPPFSEGGMSEKTPQYQPPTY